MSNIKFENLEIGQHLWVKSLGELLIVAKFDTCWYEVCGPWECGISPDDCEIIQLIDKPKGYEDMSFYYGDDIGDL